VGWASCPSEKKYKERARCPFHKIKLLKSPTHSMPNFTAHFRWDGHPARCENIRNRNRETGRKQ